MLKKGFSFIMSLVLFFSLSLTSLTSTSASEQINRNSTKNSTEYSTHQIKPMVKNSLVVSQKLHLTLKNKSTNEISDLKIGLFWLS